MSDSQLRRVHGGRVLHRVPDPKPDALWTALCGYQAWHCYWHPVEPEGRWPVCPRCERAAREGAE